MLCRKWENRLANRKKHKLLSLVLILPLLFISTAAVAPTVKITTFWDKDTIPNYVDMGNFQWASEAVDSLSKYGIINGYIENDKSYFKANIYTTRAEFAKMVVSAFGFYDRNAKNDMTDNPAEWWAYGYISSATRAKIAQGYSAEWFGSMDNILRQDVAVMLVNAIDKAGLRLNKTRNYETFIDEEKISDYAATAVKTLYEAGIVTGDKAGNFKPQSNAERVEIAVMIYRVLSVAQN